MAKSGLKHLSIGFHCTMQRCTSIVCVSLGGIALCHVHIERYTSSSYSSRDEISYMENREQTIDLRDESWSCRRASMDSCPPRCTFWRYVSIQLRRRYFKELRYVFIEGLTQIDSRRPYDELGQPV